MQNENVTVPEENNFQDQEIEIGTIEYNLKPDSVLTRIKEELQAHGSQSEKPIQILEACYYLGNLRQAF
ncbi:14880_t:CDS:2 [Gigaspora rosea]|nr:14880_t:CDS:2 [Gigaspora rosea]